MKFRNGNLLAASLALGLGFGGAASAADLTIGIPRLTTSVDPHFATAATNFPNNAHIFEPLVRLDDDAVPQPWLAESWEVIDDTTWEFRLRDDVTWHDGSPFTAEDVAFTMARAGNVPGSPASYATYLRPVAGTEVIDDHTIRILTNGPAAALLDNLSYILIASKKHGEDATTEDYHSGEATIGTGPYKFIDWSPNEFIQMERYEDYWAGVEPWTNVRLQVMASASSRMAAVLSGDIDVAESVPPQDVQRLREDERVKVWSRPSNLIVYAAIDGGEGALETGKVTGPNGEQLEENPLADERVREAMKLAINLDAFEERVYQGNVDAVGQFLLPGRPGHAEDLSAWKHDEERARELLQEAGWHEKFNLTLQVAEAAYPLAVEAAEAKAQLWSRIGIPTTVETMPYSVFLERRNARELPVFAMSFNNVWGTPENFYSTVFHTRTEDRRYGALNFPRYSNPEVDALIEEGFGTLDDEKRSDIYAEATKLIVDDAHFIPLWHVHTITATRADLEYHSRADAFLFATNVRSLDE